MKSLLYIFSLSLCCTMPLMAAQDPTITQRVDTIFSILETSANQNYIGEKISQREHALQCAKLAADDGADNETIAAALLHDIGHLYGQENAQQMNGYGVAEHEELGAHFVVSYGFSEKIAELIRGHVQAKRYLTWKDKNYYNNLSHASKETLKHQGGPMTKKEALAFEQEPLFECKLKMRAWDEQAKQVGWSVPDLEQYQSLLIDLLSN